MQREEECKGVEVRRRQRFRCKEVAKVDEFKYLGSTS